jgi:sensor histidine kinase YesM
VAIITFTVRHPKHNIFLLRFLLFLVPFIIITCTTAAQNAAIYIIDKTNGLATNHVYTAMADKFGYLWLGTDKGVYRYNGYSLRKYDYTDGLSNIDVWRIYPDSKDRLWLLNVSDQLGYIKNNKYKRAYIAAPDSTIPEIYPGTILEYNNQLIITNKSNSRTNMTSVFIVINDTIYHKNIGRNGDSTRSGGWFLTDSAFVDNGYQKQYFSKIETWLKTPSNQKSNADHIVSYNIDIEQKTASSNINGTFGKYLYYGTSKQNCLYLYNCFNNTFKTFNLEKERGKGPERLVHAYEYKKKLYVLGTKNVSIIDSNNKVSVYDLLYYFNQLPKEATNNVYFFENKLWGKILSTNNKGVFINYIDNSVFKPSKIDLTEYKFLNNIDSNTGYWWNPVTNHLLKISRGRIIKEYRSKWSEDLKKVYDLSDNTILLIMLGRIVCMHNDNTYSHFINKRKLVKGERSIFYTTIYSAIPTHPRDVVMVDSNQYFFTDTYHGTIKVTLQNKGVNVENVYKDRYQKIYYNNTNKLFTAFSKDKLLLVNTISKQKYALNMAQLRVLGIKGIENVLIDDYANIYVKDYNSLMVYNIQENRAIRLLKNFVLEDALVTLEGHTLYIAGRFGVMELDILGPLDVRKRHLFPNTKNLYYNFITDAQFSSNNIILKTDKGVLTIDKRNDIPYAKIFDRFNIVLAVDSVLMALHTNDTISISQDINFADVDVVKPTGTGRLNIIYSINGSKYANSGYQIILPKLKPGTYNNVSLVAYDDTWRSKPIPFYIYIEPKWWQTTLSKRLIIAGAITLLLGIIYLSVVYTRYIVNRNNAKKNQRRELELKSIYSQINPHFIFNSLSTAQYFVKKNKTAEAYEHINQFSNLLRSYIKSSRDKFITIAEELQNLENYLELQLTRFENKFEYQLEIDNSVNPSKIKIPSLLLQPLVENALNHGIFHSNKKGLLIISFKVDSKLDELVCIVDDNGIGRQRAREIRSEIIKKADSYGNILIKELVDTFNKYETIKIHLEYIDKIAPETGTTVIIKIKNYTNV